jgi:oxalate---CoA ligase
MATLQNTINGSPSSVAVIVPSKHKTLAVTYADLIRECASFQRRLASIGIGRGSAVSIATVNSYEFIVSFLATS